jgi:hypothetical protein
MHKIRNYPDGDGEAPVQTSLDVDQCWLSTSPDLTKSKDYPGLVGGRQSVAEDSIMMFRREMRREERRDVVEVAAVGEAVHATNKEHEEQAELAQVQAAQAQAPEQAAQTEQATEAAAPTPATPSAADLADEQVSELERVAKLKEEGILTDEEFEAEKKKILGL